MLYGFRRLISLKNLVSTLCSAARVPRSSLLSRRSAGQITTILVLILVALLIFILVTLNINQVSTEVLAIANGADAAAMKLGSSLASRSNYLYDQLGGTQKCVRGGLLGVVLAVIFAIVMWYAAPIASPLVSAMIGGAIGGAIGNVIVFGTVKAAFYGAVMGAMIGASLAGGFGIGAGWTAPGVTVTGATVGGLTTAGLTSTAISAGIVGATLATASAAYNAGLYLNNQNTEAVAAITKGLSSHGEYTSLRESIFYEALKHAVDDPTLIPDTHDLDGDGNTSEMESYFTYWWYDHINSSDSSLDIIARWVDDFMVETLIPVYEQIRLDFLPLLDRKEVECACSPGTSSGELLLSALYDCEYGMSVEVDGESAPMYEPGPDAGSLISWRCSGGVDTSPAGWDGMDALRQNFEDFVNYARTVLEEREDECGIYYDYDPDDLATQLKSDPCADQIDWFDTIYCPSSELDYHTLLEDQRAVLIASMEEIMETRDSLPGCQLKWGIYEELFVTYEGPLCQCPLTPEEFREAVLEDPETAACDQLYPCYWTNQDTYACDVIEESSCALRNICEVEDEDECFEGPHFPNPVCKVYPEDRAALTAQINEVREFVLDLETYVKDTYFRGGDPCPTPLGGDQGPYPPEQGDEPGDLSSPPGSCDPGYDWGNFCPPTEVPEIPQDPSAPPVAQPEIPEDCESGTVQFDVTIRRVGLYGDMHEPCSREGLGTGEAVLLFEFDYYIVCSCCELELVVIPPPPPSDPTAPPGETTYEYECTCSNTIYEGFGLWGWACIDAPDIDLNLVGLCSGAGGLLEFGEFLGTLGLFDEHLASLTREASACDPDTSAFATIDADAEDEFAPVIASMCEMEEQLAIFNEEIQAWGGQLLDPWSAVPPGGSSWGTGVTDAPVTVENEENGAGSLTYAWEDSRGTHEVTVTTGPFVFAWVRKEKSGNFLVNKTCMVLTDYCDNLSGCGGYRKMSPGDVYVEIERIDEVGQREVTATGEVDLGLRWYTASPTGRIRRLSRAGYSYDFVGVGGIR